MRVAVIVEEHAGLDRRDEPVTVGLPLGRGELAPGAPLGLLDEGGEPLPLQATPLALWSDGSVRWVLVDTLVSAPARGRRELTLVDAASGPVGELEVEAEPERIAVRTGALAALVPRTGGPLLESLASGGVELLEQAGLRLRLLEEGGTHHELRTTGCVLSAPGPVRATVTVRGRLGPVLVVEARVSLFAGRGLVRLDLTVRNPRRAEHPGGLWDLGDSGSVLFRELALVGRLAGTEGPMRVALAAETSDPLADEGVGPVVLHQESSGGERWDARTHINREGRVPHLFRGYRVTTPAGTRSGLRATPTLWSSRSEAALGVTVPELWQCFPKSLAARDGELEVGLWPAAHGDLHELQGGEQKTHRLWLSAERPSSLAWAAHPLLARAAPEQYRTSGAFPHLLPPGDDEGPVAELLAEAIDPATGLVARREAIDEYGWRCFGEVWADHEAAHWTGDRPMVSHYNNQYDGLYGALVQLARTGDPRWRELADPLARHVADIDVYHTREDRPAFRGGPFWHTDHYTDAGTCTHRCYSRLSPQAARGGYGGGPSDEHDYVTGLVTHYLMTGWEPSRDAARKVAEWVIDQDDGSLTRLGKVLPGPTGLSTRTVEAYFHGPGRGPGNSIRTLLDAHGLTGNDRYLHAAETLVRRVVHPDDDQDALELVTDPEHRWSYTVLLSALVHYLEVKAEREELDERYAYAQAALVAYARWMLRRERLSSEMQDLLELWTETWPAQDLRKGVVLMEAARHASSEQERAAMHGRGRELFRAAAAELRGFSTSSWARPLFLVLRYGPAGEALARHGPVAPMPRAEGPFDFGSPTRFVPWKALPGYLKARARRALGKLRA